MKILKCRVVAYDWRLRKYTIKISYSTTTEITKRTIATAEAFGIGVDEERKFPIVDSEIEINEGDIVYITGDSGSGKSSILREFKRIFGEKCIDINDLEIDKDKPLVDTVGETVDKALELLSRVGLNDAFLFIRRYSELSDGQKYRYRLAKLIESGKPVWIADEFCSTLDRDTAKIVSFNVQKIARRLGKTLIAATCNMDLDQDLIPSVRIDKRYGSEIKIGYHTNEPVKRCSLIKQMSIERGTRADWNKLGCFHYRSHRTPPTSKNGYFRIIRYQPWREPELCGVIVYSYPPIVTFGRRQAFQRVVKQPELNQVLRIISRVVVHPKYRTIGLGQILVRESLKLAPTKYTETVAVMAKYNPFFEKAGMIKIMTKTLEKKIQKTVMKLKALGFNPSLMASEQYNLRILKTLGSDKISTIRQTFIHHHHPRYEKHMGGSNKRGMEMPKEERRKYILNGSLKFLATLIRVLAIMAQTKVYLIHPDPREEKR